MATDYFDEKMKVEKEAMGQVVNWLANRFGLYYRRDVRDDKSFQDLDVDLILTDNQTADIPVEVKVRKTLFDDIALETLSCYERGTLGYLFKSKAELLAYIFFIDGKIHANSAVLDLGGLRHWFKANQARYRPQYAPNPPINPLYRSEFYAVPLDDLPKALFYPRLGGC